AGAALGVGERAEFPAAVVADRVDADHLAVFGQLDRAGDDGDVDEGAGPGPAGPVLGAGEGDLAVVVGQPGDGQARGRVPGAPGDPHPGYPVGLVGAQPLGVGGDDDPGVQDVDQPVGRHDLNRLPSVGGSDVVAEPGQGDLAVRVHP